MWPAPHGVAGLSPPSTYFQPTHDGSRRYCGRSRHANPAIMSRLIICALCLAAGAWAAAQAPRLSDANIHGHVVDAETGEHLPYYTISLEGTHFSTMTDASGHYTLRNLRPGHYTARAQCTGYRTDTTSFDIAAGQTLEINFTAVPDAFLLDQVVVTASKSSQVRRLSPSLVNVVPSAIFTRAGAATLADGLVYQPGVRVENDCQNCGFTQVRINGLDGHYTQILLDSRPVFSALAGVYGLEHIPANMIERVEVMRGGGSALFGSSAIGGTVNIITREPEVNTVQVRHSLTSIGPSRSLDNNTTFNASVVADNTLAGILVYGQSRDRNAYDHNGDGFSEVPMLKSKTLGTRMFYKPSSVTKLTLEYNTTHELRRGGDNVDLPPHQAMIAEQTDHNIHSGEVSFDLRDTDGRNHLNIYSALRSTRRNSYYGSDMDPDAYGRTTDLTVAAGSQWTHSMRHLLFMPAELVAGLEYSHNRLHDVTLGYDHNTRQSINIVGAYLQNQWSNERWSILVGARADKHSLIHNVIISPRANLRFNPRPDINLRLSYSSGFRSPQAYDEDFHVAVVGGERVVTVLAPGLKQESSHSVSASADFYFNIGSASLNFLAEGFFTTLNDVFALRQLAAPDAAGNAVLERYNGSGATVGGMNFEAKARISADFDIQAGFTWQRSRYKTPEQWSDNPDVPAARRLFRSPDTYGYITANARIWRKLRASAAGTFTGPMTVQHLAGSGTLVDRAVVTDPFFDLGITLSWCFSLPGNVDLDLSAGVGNIFNSYQSDFDSGSRRDSGYVYGPSLPRNVHVALSVSI